MGKETKIEELDTATIVHKYSDTAFELEIEGKGTFTIKLTDNDRRPILLKEKVHKLTDDFIIDHDIDKFDSDLLELFKSEREALSESIANQIPFLFLHWRTEINKIYEEKTESVVMLDFPTWLAEYLHENKKL